MPARLTYHQSEILLNILIFQILWWLCVLSNQLQIQLWIIGIVGIYVLLHLHWIEGNVQMIPLLLTTMTGAMMDQLGYRWGWIDFYHHTHLLAFIPVWMICLWLAFSCTLDVSLRWLQKKPVLSFILGGVFGPLAYWGAMRLGVVILPYPHWSLIWVALEWAFLMPLLLWIRVQFNGSLQ